MTYFEDNYAQYLFVRKADRYTGMWRGFCKDYGVSYNHPFEAVKCVGNMVMVKPMNVSRRIPSNEKVSWVKSFFLHIPVSPSPTKTLDDFL